MSEGFREKIPAQFQDQVKRVSEDLGHEITQPTKNGEVFKMSLEEIKEKFPVRYEIYLKTLRANRAEVALPEKEKEEMQEWLGVLNNLDKYIQDHHVNDEKTLRERQITVFEDMRDFLEEGGKEGYIKLPTGAGKTVVFSEFIEAIGLKTLIVVPTKILVGQTEDKLEEFAENLDVGKIYGGKKIHGDDVMIITYQSLVKKLEDGSLNPDEYRCLILDEAHTALTEKRSGAVKQFSKAIKIGFTATPKYSEDKNVGQLLNTEIHSLDVKEAAEEGVVSSFSVYLAKTDVDISGVKISGNGEYNSDDLNRAIDIESRNFSAVDLYKKMFSGQLAVAYCNGIKHAQNVAKLFNENGVEAQTIHGRQGEKEQHEIIKKYHQGEIKVLCNADILIAGFDEPKATVCLNLRPTLSPVVAEQRGGRVLRLDRDNDDKHATVVDFLDINEDKKNQSITFAEIAGVSVVYPAKSRRGGGGGDQPPVPKPEIEIEGLKVVTDSDEVMKIVNQITEEKYESAPVNWVEIDDIFQQFGKEALYVFKTFRARMREENPDWFKKYFNKDKKLKFHYSPEVVEEVNRMVELRKQKIAPQDWERPDEIYQRNKNKVIDRIYVEKYTKKLQKEHPEWFKKYIDKDNGLLATHYSPEAVLNIQEAIDARKAAPKNWTDNLTDFANKFEVSVPKVKKIIENYRTTHDEWFGNYLNKQGKFVEHYSPKLLLKIEEVLNDEVFFGKDPLQWRNADQLSLKIFKNVGSSDKVKEYAEKFRSEHSEWFRKGEYSREEYAPDLMRKIRDALKPK